MFSLEKCHQWLKPQIVSAQGSATCSGISINSKQIEAQNIFAAFHGAKCDGNDFVDDAFNNGASALLTESPLPPNRPGIQVKQLLQAVQTIGTEVRNEFTGKVVAITGSVGKTTTKNTCSQLLQQEGKQIIATSGNYNNELGVPICLARLATQDYAILELGISKPKDMPIIAKMTRPDVSIITNVAKAHSGNFTDLYAIAKEKGDIIDATCENGIIILNADDDYCAYWRKRAGERKIITVGFSDTADIRIMQANADGYNGYMVTIEYQQTKFTTRLPALGVGQVYALAFACALATVFKHNLQATMAQATKLTNTNGRMQHLELQGLHLLDDSYNSNPKSLKAAIEFLHAIAKHKPAILVLGDMKELGAESKQMHEAIGDWLSQQETKSWEIWAVGEDATLLARKSKISFHVFSNVEQLINAYRSQAISISKHSTILVKASRCIKLDMFVKHLINSKRGS